MAKAMTKAMAKAKAGRRHRQSEVKPGIVIRFHHAIEAAELRLEGILVGFSYQICQLNLFFRLKKFRSARRKKKSNKIGIRFFHLIVAGIVQFQQTSLLCLFFHEFCRGFGRLYLSGSSSKTS